MEKDLPTKDLPKESRFPDRDRPTANLPTRAVMRTKATKARSMVARVLNSKIRWEMPRSAEEVTGDRIRFKEVNHNPPDELIDMVAVVEVESFPFDGAEYRIEIAHGKDAIGPGSAIGHFDKLQVRADLIGLPSSAKKAEDDAASSDSASAEETTGRATRTGFETSTRQPQRPLPTEEGPEVRKSPEVRKGPEAQKDPEEQAAPEAQKGREENPTRETKDAAGESDQ